MAYYDKVLADTPYAAFKLLEANGAVAIADYSGNARGGTPGGGTAYVTSTDSPLVNDPAARSGSFNGGGTGRFIDLFDLDMVNSGSIEYWMKPSNTTQNARAIGKNDGNIANISLSSGLASSNKVYVEATIGTYRSLSSVASVNTTSWWHIVVTWDDANLKLYINGALDTTSASFAPNHMVNNALRYAIGQAAATVAANQFTGLIALPAFYTQALTAARVLAHWDARLETPDSNTIIIVAGGGSSISIARGTSLTLSPTVSLAVIAAGTTSFKLDAELAIGLNIGTVNTSFSLAMEVNVGVFVAVETSLMLDMLSVNHWEGYNLDTGFKLLTQNIEDLNGTSAIVLNVFGTYFVANADPTPNVTPHLPPDEFDLDPLHDTLSNFGATQRWADINHHAYYGLP